MTDGLLTLLCVASIAQLAVLATIGRLLFDMTLTVSISRQVRVYTATAGQCACPVCRAMVAPEADGRCPRCASPLAG